jgi:hypothetical protein
VAKGNLSTACYTDVTQAHDAVRLLAPVPGEGGVNTPVSQSQVLGLLDLHKEAEDV